jgi:GNAT superfamily N-acetyltransferase
MEIERASRADIDSLAEMFDQYRQFYRQVSDIDGAKAFLLERMIRNESVIFISKEKEISTGFVQCYPLFTSVGMKKTWLLNDLFVKPEFRGNGISKQLINCCKQFAKDTGAKALMLETEKTNDIGNKLYPKEGFVINASSNFYMWSVPDDK